MPKYDKDEEKYLAKCDCCQDVKPCYYQINGLYCVYSICEDCYQRYRLQLNTLPDEKKERIIREWILEKIKRIPR